ncbi:hypothetical protein C7S16_3266 [Burkholderia thailandensis]|uniref:Transposase n=1 Tax=Burkholderia thailandensis TaxID=57975 RepID=A0AAW9D6W9_BURTH|nr:hypothetical protein [Burkholderia thailandensis]MDW9257712.1 hypothetical protein [Burkholderia thailandensis]
MKSRCDRADSLVHRLKCRIANAVWRIGSANMKSYLVAAPGAGMCAET